MFRNSSSLFSVLLILLTSFLTVVSKAETTALIIGIDAYKSELISPLRGCVADAKRFKQTLMNSGFVEDENTILITDEEATKKRVIDAMSDLAEKKKRNDAVIIYFSGHGFRCPDESGDETDGEDEALCLYDTTSDSSTWFIDDQFGQLLKKISAERILIVIDSCHAGTATRTDKDMKYDGLRGCSFGFVNRKQVLDPKSFKSDWIGSSVFTGKETVLGACQPAQSATELSPKHFKALGIDEEEYAGLFTYLICDELSKNKKITFTELSKLVSMKTKKWTELLNFEVGQDPYFELPKSTVSIESFLSNQKR